MNYQVHTHAGKVYLEALPGSVIHSERDALDWVAAYGQEGACGLLLQAENLAPAFYDLKSGLAGDVLLKFVNYRLRVAAVLAPEIVGNGRFSEMASESNHSRDFRIFYDTLDARAWLLAG